MCENENNFQFYLDLFKLIDIAYTQTNANGERKEEKIQLNY